MKALLLSRLSDQHSRQGESIRSKVDVVFVAAILFHVLHTVSIYNQPFFFFFSLFMCISSLSLYMDAQEVQLNYALLSHQAF